MKKYIIGLVLVIGILTLDFDCRQKYPGMGLTEGGAMKWELSYSWHETPCIKSEFIEEAKKYKGLSRLKECNK